MLEPLGRKSQVAPWLWQGRPVPLGLSKITASSTLLLLLGTTGTQTSVRSFNVSSFWFFAHGILEKQHTLQRDVPISIAAQLTPLFEGEIFWVGNSDSHHLPAAVSADHQSHGWMTNFQQH